MSVTNDVCPACGLLLFSNVPGNAGLCRGHDFADFKVPNSINVVSPYATTGARGGEMALIERCQKCKLLLETADPESAARCICGDDMDSSMAEMRARAKASYGMTPEAFEMWTTELNELKEKRKNKMPLFRLCKKCSCLEDKGAQQVSARVAALGKMVQVCTCAEPQFEWIGENELEGLLTLDAHDVVNHPKHYTSHPSGVECIQIVEHMPFCIGSAMKYLWRAGLKGDEMEDLKKAQWYINREIERRSSSEVAPTV